MMDQRPLILASASPRRRELLARVCDAFEVVPSPLAEPDLPDAEIAPRVWVEALAHFKARSVAESYPDAWVLGADTIVVCDGEVLGKPRDREHAQQMLERQARCVSEVLTGVCLVGTVAGDVRYSLADVSRVWMHDNAALRNAYLDSGDWAGKAGAYGIQTVGDQLVAKLEGSFTNVVGLPVIRVRDLLQQAGLPVRAAVAETAWSPGGAANAN